jgi:hypothetical protein
VTHINTPKGVFTKAKQIQMKERMYRFKMSETDLYMYVHSLHLRTYVAG